MSFIDRLFVGRVIKDFGPVREKSIGVGKITTSVLLVDRHGKLKFVLKRSAWALFGASVSYSEWSLEDAYKLRDLINQTESLSYNPPIPSDDPTREVVILSLVIALVGLGVIILTQVQSCVVAVALVMVGAYAILLRQYPEIGQRLKMGLIGAAGFALMAGVAKAILLWGK
jgi:hypothetical protein